MCIRDRGNAEVLQKRNSKANVVGNHLGSNRTIPAATKLGTTLSLLDIHTKIDSDGAKYLVTIWAKKSCHSQKAKHHLSLQLSFGPQRPPILTAIKANL
eukprot:5723581-Amphidinium_carterae.1